MARENGIESTALALEQWLTEQPDGQIILPSEVPLIAERKTIRNLLAHAATQGKLDKIATGIYVKPKQHPLLGHLLPGPEAVAEAIARRDGARLIPTGALALNQLGLSTQVPMRIVYLTNGSPRVVKVGKAQIRFMRASPKLLEMKGRLSQLVTLALRELGRDGVDEEATKKLTAALAAEDLDALLHDALLVPAWMQKYFHRVIKSKTITGE